MLKLSRAIASGTAIVLVLVGTTLCGSLVAQATVFDPAHDAAAEVTTGPVSMTIANIGGGTLTYASTGSSVVAATSSFTTATIGTDENGDPMFGTLSSIPNTGVVQSGLPAPLLATEISQMDDNTPTTAGIACFNVSGGIRETSWLRRFYFNEYPQVGSSTRVVSVQVSTGIDTYSGGVPGTINLYTLPHTTPVDTIPSGDLTLIGSADFTAIGDLQMITVPVTGTVDDTVGKDLVVEWHADDGSERFTPGSNASPESHPTFIQSVICGSPDPVTVASVGFSDFHMPMVVTLVEVTYTVTPSVSGPGGSILPSTPQEVIEGDVISFTLVPDNQYVIAGASGCGGSLSGDVYTTGPITADCTILVRYAATIPPHVSVPALDRLALLLLAMLLMLSGIAWRSRLRG